MFVLEFEKPLFEFAYARPHWAPLFALPPTFSNRTTSAFFRESFSFSLVVAGL